MTANKLVDILIKIQKPDAEVLFVDLDDCEWGVDLVKFEDGIVVISPKG